MSHWGSFGPKHPSRVKQDLCSSLHMAHDLDIRNKVYVAIQTLDKVYVVIQTLDKVYAVIWTLDKVYEVH